MLMMLQLMMLLPLLLQQQQQQQQTAGRASRGQQADQVSGCRQPATAAGSRQSEQEAAASKAFSIPLDMVGTDSTLAPAAAAAANSNHTGMMIVSLQGPACSQYDLPISENQHGRKQRLQHCLYFFFVLHQFQSAATVAAAVAIAAVSTYMPTNAFPQWHTPVFAHECTCRQLCMLLMTNGAATANVALPSS